MSCAIPVGTGADGSWGRDREARRGQMFGHRERRATKRSTPTPIGPKGSGPTAPSSLSCLVHNERAFSHSSLLESGAVALRTPVPTGRVQDTSDLYHPNWDQRRWVLLGRSRRETEVDVFTSTTARNKDIAGNPHRPRGFGRNGIVFVVVSSSQCWGIYSSPTPRIQRRLARTLVPIWVVQATSL